MGQVINSSAAADDIIADVQTTYARAEARGGLWKEQAEQRLTDILAVIASLKSRLATIETQLVPLAATVVAQDVHADRFIGQVSDTIWNAIGRPAFDPSYDVVFPGGIACYTDGTNESQPDRMDLLAELLDLKIIAKLDPALLTSLVQQVRDESAAYRKLIESYAPASLRLRQLQRAKTAVAQSARMQLAQLKRVYKAEGFSEADIHSVIPDRPRSTKKVEPTPAAPVAPNANASTHEEPNQAS